MGLNANGRRYTSPNPAQWESIIPYHNPRVAVNIVGGQAVDGAELNVQVGSASGKAKYTSRRVGSVVYAIALDNFGGTNKRRVAYRYQEVENPHAPTGQQPYLLITYTKRGRPAQTVMNSKFTAKAQSQWKVFNRVAFQVDAVHLGEQFIGGIDDIANVSFWENTSLRKETRIIPINYTSYNIEGWSASP